MEEKMLYKDASQPVEARVEDLLSRMTLEEKAAQLCGDLAASFIVDGKLSHEALVEKFKDGHGRITQYSLVGLVSPKQIAVRKSVWISGSRGNTFPSTDQCGGYMGTRAGRRNEFHHWSGIKSSWHHICNESGN